MSGIAVGEVTPERVEAAVGLLARFFAEEGFAGDEAGIARNLRAMLDDPGHWAALATRGGEAVGVVTVTTMLYVEWGRLGEIGDLYVVPAARGRGVARRLVDAACAWCLDRGCSAVQVVTTSEGAAKGLGRFYDRLGFRGTGRTIATRVLNGAAPR